MIATLLRRLVRTRQKHVSPDPEIPEAPPEPEIPEAPPLPPSDPVERALWDARRPTGDPELDDALAIPGIENFETPRGISNELMLMLDVDNLTASRIGHEVLIRFRPYREARRMAEILEAAPEDRPAVEYALELRRRSRYAEELGPGGGQIRERAWREELRDRIRQRVKSGCPSAHRLRSLALTTANEPEILATLHSEIESEQETAWEAR